MKVPQPSTLPSQALLQTVWLLLEALADSKGTADSSSANFTVCVAGHRQPGRRTQHPICIPARRINVGLKQWSCKMTAAINLRIWSLKRYTSKRLSPVTLITCRYISIQNKDGKGKFSTGKILQHSVRLDAMFFTKILRGLIIKYIIWNPQEWLKLFASFRTVFETSVIWKCLGCDC